MFRLLTGIKLNVYKHKIGTNKKKNVTQELI